MTGSKLAHYEVKESLGTGGMGEVYRATDTKLEREVALKVLPDAMACDPERVARFEREAKLLASLNHPGIAAIYGFEHAEGKRFLVLEVVEGPTLAERISAGPLMVEEALDIARQIAEALEAAHERGIIHRDLKPANVKITPDGQVKVLDFGLAKALVEADPDMEADPGTSPTITHDYTRPGVILGTAAYMSPEQARGRPVDKRCDIWSFGVVLYECLTADSLFRGETVTDSVGAILHKQPDWDKLPPGTPPTIQLLLRRCLAKDRKRRLRDIGDVRIELEAAIADPTSSALGLASAAIAAEGRHPLWNRKTLAAIGGAMGFTAIVAAAIGWSLHPKPPEPPTERYTITLPQRESDFFRQRFFDVSADGRLLAYLATSEGSYNNRSIFRRPLDKLDPVPVVEGAGNPRCLTFSPDGKWIAYYEGEKDVVLKVSVEGGPRTELCDINGVNRLSWAENGFIVFASSLRSGVLFRMGENGGTVEEIPVPDGEKKWPRFPHVTPDGKSVLYALAESQRGSTAKCSIEAYFFETGRSHTVVDNGTFPLVTGSGHLLFLRESTLMVASFDGESLKRTSEPVPVLAGVATEYAGSGAGIALTDGGTLYYSQGGTLDRETPQSLYLHKLDGDEKPGLFLEQAGLFRELSISPDGSLIALEIEEATGDARSVWLLDTKLNVLAPLSTEPGNQGDPHFSPDGAWVYYSASDKDGQWLGLYRRRSDHSGSAELVDDGPRACWVDSISPDGKTLFVAEMPDDEQSPGTHYDLAVVHLGENGEKSTRDPWYRGESYQPHVEVSPDGRWVAYMSGHAGAPHLYVRHSSGEGAVHPISGVEGGYPMWSPDGRKIYFQSVQKGSAILMSVDVLEGSDIDDGGKPPVFKVGETTQVMELGSGIGSLPGAPSVQIMPDGKGFLRIADAPQEGKEGGEDNAADDLRVIHVWRNFFAELERLAPTK